VSVWRGASLSGVATSVSYAVPAPPTDETRDVGPVAAPSAAATAQPAELASNDSTRPDMSGAAAALSAEISAPNDDVGGGAGPGNDAVTRSAGPE
jgi:hypothetical protein